MSSNGAAPDGNISNDTTAGTAPATGSAPVARPKTTGLHVGEPARGVAKVDPIIVADGVHRAFGGVTAVDVAHLEIPRGAITAGRVS